MEKFAEFARIAEIEFSQIVLSTQDLGQKLRIYLVDKTFVDFFYTTNLKTKRFSLHWERVHIDGLIYRLDNTPDKKWRNVSTFPLHFHMKVYDQVVVSPFGIGNNDKLGIIFRKFFYFVQHHITVNL